MIKKTDSVCEQLRLSQNFDGTVLCASLHEIGFIPLAAQFRLPSGFALFPVRYYRYFYGASQDNADSRSGISLGRRFCTAATIGTVLQIMKGFSAEFAAWGQVQILNVSIMEVFLPRDRSLVSILYLASIISRVLGRQ